MSMRDPKARKKRRRTYVAIVVGMFVLALVAILWGNDEGSRRRAARILATAQADLPSGSSWERVEDWIVDQGFDYARSKGERNAGVALETSPFATEADPEGGEEGIEILVVKGGWMGEVHYSLVFHFSRRQLTDIELVDRNLSP